MRSLYLMADGKPDVSRVISIYHNYSKVREFMEKSGLDHNCFSRKDIEKMSLDELLFCDHLIQYLTLPKSSIICAGYVGGSVGEISGMCVGKILSFKEGIDAVRKLGVMKKADTDLAEEIGRKMQSYGTRFLVPFNVDDPLRAILEERCNVVFIKPIS